MRQLRENNKVSGNRIVEAAPNSESADANPAWSDRRAPHLHAIFKIADQELRDLMLQRAKVAKRISTIKKIIAGLSTLIGDEELPDDLCEFVHQKAKRPRRPGLTQECRRVLMQANCALNAQDVANKIEESTPPAVPQRKHLLASVAVVLDRLVQYGEARRVHDNGHRAWVWVEEVETAQSPAGPGQTRS
jgi:hypothetical protein